MFWRKGPACKQEELSGLDPEQFHPISDAVAQYQDSLYTIIETESGDRKLEIVKLDDPNLIINKRFNAGKRHGYLLTRAEGWVNHSSLHVFESDGPLILLDNRSPDEREAHLNDHPFCADGMPAITATFTALMARSSGDTAPLIRNKFA